MGYSLFDETMVDMTWPEIEEAIKQKAVVLLPVGVIEEHGPHMGLAVDIYVSYLISKLIKQYLEGRSVRVLIAPPYYWGINDLTGCFPGSFNVRPETMKAVLLDTLSSLNGWGVTHTFFINWHGEYKHNLAILEAVKESRTSMNMKAYCFFTDSEIKNLKFTGQEDYVIIENSRSSQGTSSPYVDLHAGSLETGIMLNYFPEQVNLDLAATLEATKITFNDLKAVRKAGNEIRKLIPSGYFGNPAGFNPETGKQSIESKAMDYAGLIEGVLKSK